MAEFVRCPACGGPMRDLHDAAARWRCAQCGRTQSRLELRVSQDSSAGEDEPRRLLRFAPRGPSGDWVVWAKRVVLPLLILAVAGAGVFLWLGARGSGPAKSDDTPEVDYSVATAWEVPLPTIPPRPDLTVFENGVRFAEVRVSDKGPAGRMRMWLYLPPGEHAPATLSCVVIAPAGSNLITGATLGDDSRPEHFPYVRAGFAVLAYGLDGAMEDPGKGSPEEVQSAVKRFMRSRSGLVNARTAIEFLRRRVSEVDPSRIVAAGHSSAANIALLVAAVDPRLRACIAYAPAPSVAEFFGPRLKSLERILPGLGDFAADISPIAHASDIQCPIFLFHSEQDRTVSIDAARRLAQRLRAAGRNVTFTTFPTGDHYDAMIDQGIPKAIEWLKALPARPSTRTGG